MDFWANFWGLIWWFLWAFVFIAYLMALFSVIGDLFRDHELKGGYKALWFVFLIFVPFLTVLVYLIARGEGMARRSNRAARQTKDEAEAYIREVAGSSPASQIAEAKSLLDAGAITKSEFETLKAKALA
ncbi:MAG: SHOCT domain-containing protein [Actinomycetales bacterium]|nr:SHOCT domain-containing protein [Actinomycetales bacterium]